MTIWVFQGGTASWFDDASWLSTAQPPANGVPGAGDTAEIGSGTADMGSNSDTIAALDLTGGDLIGTGTLSATGGSQWSSGYIGESLVVALSGTSVLGGVQIGGSATVENFGTVTDTGNLSLGDSSGTSATLLNEAGAIFNIANAITIGNGASTALFTNMGTIATLAGSGTSAIAAIDNTGTIKIAANTAVQLGGTTTEVGGTISGAGTLILGSIGSGGAEYLESSAVLSVATILITGQYPDVVLNGNITYNGNFLVEASNSLFGGNAAPIDLNGQTLTLGGKVTLASSTYEYGAVWIGGGGTLVTKGATVVPAANQALTLGSGTTWSNAGSVQERGNLQLGDQSGIDVTFTNQSTGTVDFTASASISSDDPTSSFFNNAGLLEVGNRTSSGAVQANIVNTGTITAIAGQLTLGTGGSATSNTGLITASAGGTVYVQDGLANTGNITAAANSLVWLQAGGSLGGTFAYAVAGALTGTQFQLQSDGGSGTDVVVGVPGQTFTLTTGTDSFLGGIGNDSFIAKTNTLNAGDSLDGAGGTNTLVLSGAGTFNLAAPAALNHITIVQASETGQTITLRAGTADSVNVTSGATADTIIGAANTDVVSLGAAADKITIGGAGETFDGIGTKYSFSAAGQAASALINVATGTSSLAVSGGGTIALNAGDNGLATVTLASSSTAYSFTANAEIGLKITDASSGHDTISAGGIGEILTGGAAGQLTMIGDISGGTTFFDTSALLNGDLIENLATAGSELDVSDLAFSSLTGTFTENTSATMGTLNLTDGTHATSISIAGSFAAAGFSGSLSAAGFVVSSDGHTGTAIGFH